MFFALKIVQICIKNNKMLRLYPETKFSLEVAAEPNLVLPYFTEKLVGEHAFQIDSIFGKKEAIYNGSSENGQIIFSRSIDSWNKIPVYPTSKIKFTSASKTSILHVRCSLSRPWLVFFYFVYSFLILAFLIGWFDAFSLRDKTILVFKTLGSIIILNAIIFGYHFSELKNIKRILDEVGKQCSH